MPSTINELMLSEIKGAIGSASSLIVLDPSKLKSNESLALRKNLRGCGATLKVPKKSQDEYWQDVPSKKSDEVKVDYIGALKTADQFDLAALLVFARS